MGLETAAIIALAAASVTYAGATMYSSSQQAKAAKSAAAATERVGMAQIQATKDSENIAAETARTKLRAKQASVTDTILTSPLGATDNTNKATLGV
jgi:hypothetical protein